MWEGEGGGGQQDLLHITMTTEELIFGFYLLLEWQWITTTTTIIFNMKSSFK